MITKNNIRFKMTIVPMVIFCIALVAFKFGDYSRVMDNQAEAATLPLTAFQDSAPVELFAAITNWRESKIIRNSLSYDPSAFYDMSAKDIQNLFGAPSLHRADGPAEMLQYTSGKCAADFYYLNGGVQRITHYEIRQTGNVSADCLDTLLQNL